MMHVAPVCGVKQMLGEKILKAGKELCHTEKLPHLRSSRELARDRAKILSGG